MSFRSKIYPSLSNKAFAFLDSPLELKLTLKTTEETSFPKHQTKSSRSTSPQTIFIPKSSNFSSSQDKIHSARAHSQDKEFNSTKRPTLPILQTIKAYKENNKQKLTSKNLKNKGENSDSNQTSIKRINRSAEKKHSKGFRIRTSTSSNNIVSLDILKSSKTKSFQKNKVKKPGSMPTVGDEPDLFTSRTCNLNRMCFNIPSQARTNLPLLIVHFEGIIGSCLIHNKENISKDSNLLEEYFFVKKDVKEEMKQLSKKFVIAIVFPTLNNKYKVAMKHLINRKFPFDGAYYKTQTSETSNPYSINKYILDYKTVINDFRAHKTNRKVILLLPLGLSTSLIQKHLLQKEPETNFSRRFSLDKSCFIHFFPKMEAVNRKFLCVPNFLLEEKNEQYAALYKSEFCSLTRLLIRTLESGFPKNQQLIKSKTRDFDPIMVTNDESSRHEIENVPDLVEQKEFKNVTEEKSESYDKNQLKELNFEGLLYEMERMTKINDKLKGLGSIKDNFGVQKENPSFIFDQSAMRQKMVEILAYIQREKITAGGINPKENGVLITGVVGDLFTSNANIIKIYEKDSFYANKNQLKKITAITEYLHEKNNDNTLEEQKNEDEIIIRTGGMKERSRIFKFFNPKKDENNSSLDFSSDKSKLKFACEDNYSLELLLIKEIASEIYLYTQEEINNFES